MYTVKGRQPSEGWAATIGMEEGSAQKSKVGVGIGWGPFVTALTALLGVDSTSCRVLVRAAERRSGLGRQAMLEGPATKQIQVLWGTLRVRRVRQL